MRVRTIYGGPAPAETRRAWQVENERAALDETWHTAQAIALQDYRARLQETVAVLLSS